ncbi:Nuclear import receptor [Salix suchowensis]|nr:Nuclear import receptor [Salix suchowensis]
MPFKAKSSIVFEAGLLPARIRRTLRFGGRCDLRVDSRNTRNRRQHARHRACCPSRHRASSPSEHRQRRPEKIRGYARIFAEAGETYRLLLLQHTETFFPIVEAIGECSAYPDLDIVPITFPFWMRLAQVIGKKPSVSHHFQDAYRSLMAVIIQHLHFPPDAEPLSAQDAEKFRSFRHVMGDTLKDCCMVLRPETCITATYNMVANALSQPPGSVSWQAIEAPLFAMRSMGAEVDPRDNTAVPKIMDLLPSLPDFPRVRYAALLIISRYTEWISQHPEYIQAQLQYISTGFQSSDIEVSAAAGQALKYLCQDCKEHLVDFLPTLHTFLTTTGAALSQEDRREVYEAIAYVISAMPMDRAADSLRTFVMDIMTQVHAITGKGTATKQELQVVGCKLFGPARISIYILTVCLGGLENLEVMLHVVRGFGEDLPEACQNTCQEMWTVFDNFITKYGNDYGIAERTTRVLRHGITLYGKAGLNVAPSVVARMAQAFTITGSPVIYGLPAKLSASMAAKKVRNFVHRFWESTKRPRLRLCPYFKKRRQGIYLMLADFAPDVFYQSSAFPLAFRATMAALTMVHSDILFASLDLFRIIFTHECLTDTTNPPPKYPLYAAAIQSVFEKEGFEFLGLLLAGLIGDFPEDSASTVVSIFRATAIVWMQQLLTWLPSILQQLPNSAAPADAKTQFFADVSKFVVFHDVHLVR